MSLTMHDTTIHEGPVSLEQMPIEVLEFILSNVPSIDTLWNLLRASPRCWRILATGYASITEAVLSGPNSTTPLFFRELIRVVALVRMHKFPFANLEDFRGNFLYRIAHPDNCYWYHYASEAHIIFGPNSLPDSPDAITSVVATGYHISALEQSLLASCLQRLERANLSCSLPAHGMGQPTYIEEMRAVRAL
ncbi:hypothetical protein FVEN_g12654 [Fusarium venenatum]|uniref:F-box domain-containing protein n=1 Tax=Fusarium venenatum TaxID=56646 RepID=A0A2L2TJP6_9HYPO|nr:uncharacterized protein FVRRES_10395 [Fusarium venenatum]KAG8361225.1 hypothetical protein FVEN_g12654 [Fusarium venenatum]KAH6967004.1 hypothetical protein EDB82DRAFT_481298 [Fusarium venenatum]CEI70318.1 unnamed protein product [Fusarium venenatum]